MAQTVTIIKVFEDSNYAVVGWERGNTVEYVACWLPKIRNANGDWIPPSTINEGVEVSCYWEQGHYFVDELDAIEYAVDKEIEALNYKADDLKERITRLERRYCDDRI